jgi:hypothetical protein
MKNTIASLKNVNETNHNHNSISSPTLKQVDFLLCQSCLWCALCFNFDESLVVSCPLCHNDQVEQLPVSSVKNAMPQIR